MGVVRKKEHTNGANDGEDGAMWDIVITKSVFKKVPVAGVT
jgi:hypothetical protein